jgi:histidine phosphotransferase ChpT
MPQTLEAADSELPGLRLAELLCARLCHDFSGPLGALIAAAELLGEEGVDRAEASAAVLESAHLLARRLRYLRAAWGAGGSATTPAELLELADGVPGQGRVRLDLAALPADAPLGPGLSRTLLSAVLLAGEALPRGGTVRLLADPAGGRLLLLPEGRNVTWPAGLAGALAGATSDAALADTTPRTLLAPLTAVIAREAGFVVSVAASPGDAPALLVIEGAARPAK